jgi:hypothetical protein
MKSIFSFIISLSLSLLTTYNLSAQHSLLHGDNSWMVYYETMESSDYLFGQIVYYNNTPFHVDGKRYETMIISHNSNVRDYYSNKDKYPELYYREEANKIIRYDPYAEADIIMFEFGHEVGDTLTDGDGNLLEVTEVFPANMLTNYSMFNNGEKAYRLRGLDNVLLDDIWIDNVGSMKTGIFRQSDFEDIQFSHLSFFSGYEGNYSIAFPLNYNEYKSMPFFKIHEPDPDDDENENDDNDNDQDLDWDSDYFMEEEEYIHCEFLDDTLHIEGRSWQLYKDNFDVMYCTIKDNRIELFYQPIQYLGYIQADCIGHCDFDLKLSGFRKNVYVISIPQNFFEMITPQEMTLTCGDRTNGDINGDGITDISDVVAIINVIAGTEDNDKADVNGDGKRDIADVVAVINIIASTI